MDPILPILSSLGYWAIILGTFGGPGSSRVLSALTIKALTSKVATIYGLDHPVPQNERWLGCVLGAFLEEVNLCCTTY